MPPSKWTCLMGRAHKQWQYFSYRPAGSFQALRPGHPAHNTGMRPIQESKNKNTPKIATFLRLRIAAGRQNTDEARKNGKLDARRPISTSQRTEGSPQSQKSCTEIGILVFARRIVAAEHILRKTSAPPKPIGPSSITGSCGINQARHSRPRLRQRSRAGPTELTLAKSRTNPTKKCNIRRETMGKTSEIAGNY